MVDIEYEGLVERLVDNFKSLNLFLLFVLFMCVYWGDCYLSFYFSTSCTMQTDTSPWIQKYTSSALSPTL
jgi:hypothetical protein